MLQKRKIVVDLLWYILLIRIVHGDDLDNDVVLPTHDHYFFNITQICNHTLLNGSFYCIQSSLY